MNRQHCPHCNKYVRIIAPDFICENCSKSMRDDGKTVPETEIESNALSHDDNDASSDGDSGGISINLGEGSSAVPPIDNEKELETTSNTDVEKEQVVTHTQILHKVAPNPDRITENAAGWLVQHTEGKEEVVHPLLEGENFFGTPADGYHTDIAIENDRYVSRSHANIMVSKDFLGRFHYVLYDNGLRRSDRQSTNGTFVNGHSERLPKEEYIFLRHGDTIQIGLTKLVLVDIEQASTPEAAKEQVLVQDYTATVELRRTQ